MNAESYVISRLEDRFVVSEENTPGVLETKRTDLYAAFFDDGFLSGPADVWDASYRGVTTLPDAVLLARGVVGPLALHAQGSRRLVHIVRDDPRSAVSAIDAFSSVPGYALLRAGEHSLIPFDEVDRRVCIYFGPE